MDWNSCCVHRKCFFASHWGQSIAMKWPIRVLFFLLSIAGSRGFQVQFHRVNGEFECVNDPPDIGIQYHVNSEVQCAIECVNGTKINDCLGYSWNQETSTCRLCNDGAILDNRPDIKESTGTIVGFRDCAIRCSSGWFYFACKCYRFEPTPLPHQSAEDYCVAFGNGSHLASVHSQEENDFIRAISTSSSVWIGANDRTVEGTYINNDGTQYDYLNWSRGEPNNSGDEDCAVMLSTGQWNDSRCSGSVSFVCKGNGY